MSPALRRALPLRTPLNSTSSERSDGQKMHPPTGIRREQVRASRLVLRYQVAISVIADALAKARDLSSDTEYF